MLIVNQNISRGLQLGAMSIYSQKIINNLPSFIPYTNKNTKKLNINYHPIK